MFTLDNAMPSSFLQRSARLLGALLLVAASGLAVAQSDPPSRVGRLSLVEGSVSFAPGGSEDWGPAEFNRPLTSGDRLQTGPGARAELHSGSTALRLAGQTVLEISELDDDNTRLTLTQGTLALRVRNLYPGERMEINTPNLAFTVSQPGEYRLDVDPNYRTTGITVRSGSGVAYGENGAARTLGSQQQIRFADRQLAQEVAQNNPPRDGFDLWSFARDKAEDQSQSARYVSRDTIGYQQLDSYGDWRTDTQYGPVWIPRVSSGQWAPYRNGQWRWVPPWGWTWVDDAPWGFAPFHYGRWAQIGLQWAWVPGPIRPRPVYAPALVGFPHDRDYAWQDHRRPPSSGWFPLAPGEPWRPNYRPPQRGNEHQNRPPDARPDLPGYQAPGAPVWRGDRPRPFEPDAGRVPHMVQPPQPGIAPRPGGLTDAYPQAIPRPRPEMRPAEIPQQPTPAARNQAEQDQRALMQRQQQAERERAQQEQNRNQAAREQDQRQNMQQQIQRQQQERQRQEQFQREQSQRESQQRQQATPPGAQPQPGAPDPRQRVPWPLRDIGSSR